MSEKRGLVGGCSRYLECEVVGRVEEATARIFPSARACCPDLGNPDATNRRGGGEVKRGDFTRVQ